MGNPDEPENSAQDFERRMAKHESPRFSFTLYVAGATSRSLRAIENARSICEEFLRGRYELDIVDVYKNPAAAKSQQVVAIPTLVRNLPAPLRQAIGDLSARERIVAGLGLAA